MSQPLSPLKAWQEVQDGIAGMIASDAKMDADFEGFFDPEFDTCATQAMEGFKALIAHHDAFADMVGVLAAQPSPEPEMNIDEVSNG